MSMLRRHERARCLAALIPIVLLGLVAAPASADPAKARAHFDLGKRYFEVDEYGKAIAEFKAAHVEEPDPAFLYNIAECYRHMGETKEALVFYRRFLALSPANSPSRPSVEKRVAALQAAMRGAEDAPAAPATAGTPAPKLSPAPAGSTPAGTAPTETRAPAATTGAAPVTLAMAPPASTTAPPAVELRDQASAAPTTDTSRPFYKKPWFYIVVGGALVAGTVGAFALASGKTESPPSTPLGNQPAFR